MLYATVFRHREEKSTCSWSNRPFVEGLCLMKLDSILEDYLFQCSVERRLAENTAQAYRSDLQHFFAFQGGESATSSLTVSNLKKYLAHMLGEAGLSTATARRRIACLRGFCRFAAEKYGLADPFEAWSPSLKRSKRLPRAVSCTEIKSLIEPVDRTRHIDTETVFAILLISVTGIRVSELCAIRSTDVSPDGSSIHITGKGSKDRIVYVSDEELRCDLMKRRTVRIAQEGEMARLLLNSRGAALQPQALRRRLRNLCARANLPRIVTPHMLRHTAATLLIESGTDIRFVQRLLGHASIATTEIYTQVNDRSLRRAVFEANTLQLIAAAT